MHNVIRNLHFRCWPVVIALLRGVLLVYNYTYTCTTSLICLCNANLGLVSCGLKFAFICYSVGYKCYYVCYKEFLFLNHFVFSFLKTSQNATLLWSRQCLANYRPTQHLKNPRKRKEPVLRPALLNATAFPYSSRFWTKAGSAFCRITSRHLNRRTWCIIQTSPNTW